MNNQPRRMGYGAWVALVASSVLVLAGCGGGGDKKPDGGASKSSSSHAAGSTGGSAPASASPTQILAQIKGEKNVEVSIYSAARDSGGFVTIQGAVTNNGTDVFDATNWVGQETAVSQSGASVAGAVLVDQAGKKRYYVLRDTDGKCLCTMKLLSIQPKETRPIFAQFPAPPAGTTSVEFQLPTMPPAKIQISEG
ncbi:hypothetical protein QMK19_23505 [Streptomyces sp. H10-C2]|uniref:hypothetical protein n=1 Tax=unclassified Streptomyces TaxID=2593676 RepID=UPI0024B915ED|nr:MULTISPECIES: hypothetical protein [unclassified Streptomyces]MDJ0342740.1 hypothetical protein [Streptomyces sp. PH10-H1]MDJ0372550.1 hypothetical protein [Streptomyces sp. H10-C2]